MKKTSLIIIIVIAILLSSCTSSADVQKESENASVSSDKASLYKVQLLSNMDDGIFKSDSEKYNPTEDSFYETEKDAIQTVNIGKNKLELKYVSQKHYTDGSVVDVYFDEDNNVEYSKGENTFFVKAKGEFLNQYTPSHLSETDLLDHINSYIFSYVANEDYKDYVYECSTKIVVSKKDVAWAETKDGFYLPKSSYEKVRSYLIEYRKYSHDLPTADALIIQCDGNGNITHFYNYAYSVKWEDASFESKSVDQSISLFLRDNLNSKYNLKNYQIDSQRLIYSNNEIRLSLTLSITLDDQVGQFVVLCPLIVSKSA